MDTINIILDGKKITAPKDQTILQIAADHGIEIPTLCYNEKISHTTSCFVCLVRDVKTGKFMPSCSMVPADGMEIDASGPEVLDMRRTALNLLLSEHAGDCEAPCTIACPAHALVEEYVRAGREGRFLDALKIIKERIPLPMSIGRICPRFCEKDCRRNVHDQPVGINEVKRLAADLFYDDYLEELPVLTGQKVAVIGAGPGGLSAAYFLRRLGVAPIIYEKLPEPGGMLRYEIPEFRLPKRILAREIAHFHRMGIKIECGRELGRNLQLEELKKQFDAIVVTIGCWQPSVMRIEGEEFAEQGIDYLLKVAKNNYQYANPGRTIVIGGGSTAMDCCRVPLRLGSPEVSCYYRRTEKEMPAEKVEVEEAREEGVKFHFLTAPLKLRKGPDGRLVLTCQKMELGEPDASGRRRPVPVVGSEFDVEADTVISAIGQQTKAAPGLKTNKWGNLAVDDDLRLEDNVFAAGDCVSGAATVVEAVTGGRKAALAVVDFLNHREHREPKVINVSRGHWQHLKPDDLVYLQELKRLERIKPHFIALEERKTTFKEIFPTFSESEVTQEGTRCIECSCTAKTDCKLKKYSEQFGAEPDAIQGEKVVAGYDNRHPEIIHDRLKCIKCGVCIKICSEVINKNLLSLKNRGYYSRVETAFNQGLPLSCRECGACIEECPVGALDWKKKKDEPPK